MAKQRRFLVNGRSIGGSHEFPMEIITEIPRNSLENQRKLPKDHEKLAETPGRSQGGLCLAISSAVLSAVAAHAIAAAQHNDGAAPSSCGVARNGTTSCRETWGRWR